MKNSAKIFLSLILAAWLLIEYARRPNPAMTSIPATAQKPEQTVALTFATKDAPAGESGAESPRIEDSWAKELRELKELAANDPDAALTRVAQMPEEHDRKTAAMAV